LSSTRDRPFKVIALVAGLCLVGFVAYVVASGGRATRGTTDGSHATFPSSPPAMLKIGSTAPSFSLPRLGGGDPVTLAGYAGVPVMVSFFASWCPHCREELADFATVARQQSGKLAVIGVDANDGPGGAAQPLLAQAHASYPVAVDAQGSVARRYLLSALPVTYFLDRTGRVRGAAFGAVNTALLERWARGLEEPAT
jgi:peroxiredoxin